MDSTSKMETPKMSKLQSIYRRLHRRKPYTYSALDEDAHEIRLLTILPGSFKSKIRLHLETKAFTSDSNLQFEALSYAWGSPENPVEITLGGSGSQSTITVTRNLAEALPCLRHENRKRIIWIDAICVNQQDLAERSSQVKRMASIYSSALRVIVWLGPESSDSALAIECCKTISSKIIVDWGTQTMSPSSAETHWASEKELLPFSEAEFISIYRLLDRDWFKRLWIWQEVSLAREIVVLCGMQMMSWTEIKDTAFSIVIRPKPWGFTERINSQQKKLVYDLCRGVMNIRFDQLIDFTKHSLCSDPRDRIFALFSLLSEVERGLAIEPDYSKSHSKIYQDFVKHYIRHKNNLGILSTIEVLYQFSDTPSWVPNWSIPRITRPLGSQRASGSSEASTIFEADGCLQVIGLTIGTIDRVEAFKFPSLGSSDDHSLAHALELQRIVQVLNLQGLLDENCQSLQNLCRVLCGNSFAERSLPPDLNLPGVQEAENSLREILWRTNEELWDYLSTVKSVFHDRFHATCYGRSLFKCLDGAIGLAPQGARPGDKVVVWLGSGSAMILRPFQESQYRVIGEAYHDGAMNSSAFLGPLPDSFKLVLQLNEEYKPYSWRFLDKESGTFSAEDPRLRDLELPLGWRRAYVDDAGNLWFVNDSTGKETWRDPRHEAESFRSRGVKLEAFELI